MSRPFIEFLHSQHLPWTGESSYAARRGVEEKILSVDSETGAATLLLRYPPGWAELGPSWCQADEEVFVLSGQLALNGREFRSHHYGYWPRGHVRRSLGAGVSGAVVLTCFSGKPAVEHRIAAAPVVDPAALVEWLDPFHLAWDQTAMDPHIGHLNAFRKNLRLAPDGSGRTYLLAGLPQGYPASGTEPLERHPHCEEMFLIAGDMPCSRGIMREGAYFWRPPMIWHGADCTVNGFLMFMRTPGTNQTISEWADEGYPVSFNPPHQPVAPVELAAALAPLAERERY